MISYMLWFFLKWNGAYILLALLVILFLYEIITSMYKPKGPFTL